jgi:hypothetical protein
MPCIVRVDTALNCGFFLWQGQLVGAAAEIAFSEFRQHPEFQVNMKRFSDMRRASLSVAQAHITAVAERTHFGPSTGQPAVQFAVLVATEVDFGTVRLYFSEAACRNANVFRDLDKAMEWLHFSAAQGDPFAIMMEH